VSRDRTAHRSCVLLRQPHRLGRCQDDLGPARPAHAPPRHHRDRQR